MRLGNLDSTPLLKAFRRLSHFDHVANFHALPLSGKTKTIRNEWKDKLDSFKRDIATYDVSYTSPIIDSIFSPSSALADSLLYAADAFHVDYAYCTSCGTTLSNEIVLSALAKPGDRVLVDGSSHQSIKFGLAHNGLNATSVPAGRAGNRIAADVAAMESELLRAQQSGEPHNLVVLTSASYDGVMVKLDQVIPRWASISPDTIFVVDAAWAAIHCFADDEKQHSVSGIRFALEASGLDARVVATTSLHKTLNAMRQASAILVIDRDRTLQNKLKTAIYTHHTTSPSWAILASGELAIAHAVAEGNELVREAKAMKTGFMESLSASSILSSCVRVDNTHLEDDLLFDPLKVLVEIDSFGDLSQLRSRLFNEFGVYIARCIGTSILLNFTVSIDAEDIDRLIYALTTLLRQKTTNDTKYSLPEFGTTISNYVIAYPPGVPLAVPGDVWQGQHLKKLTEEAVAGSDIFVIPSDSYVKELFS